MNNKIKTHTHARVRTRASERDRESKSVVCRHTSRANEFLYTNDANAIMCIENNSILSFMSASAHLEFCTVLKKCDLMRNIIKTFISTMSKRHTESPSNYEVKRIFHTK